MPNKRIQKKREKAALLKKESDGFVVIGASTGDTKPTRTPDAFEQPRAPKPTQKEIPTSNAPIEPAKSVFEAEASGKKFGETIKKAAYQGMFSLIRKAGIPIRTSAEEKAFRSDFNHLTGQLKYTLKVINNNSTTVEHLAKENEDVAELLRKAKDPEIAGLIKKVLENQAVTPKEFQKISKVMGDLSDGLNEVGASLEFKMTDVVDEIAKTAKDSSQTLDYRRNALEQFIRIAKSSGVQREHLANLQKLVDTGVNFTPAQNEELGREFGQIRDKVQDQKTYQTLEEMNKGIDSLVFNQDKANRILNRKVDGENARDRFGSRGLGGGEIGKGLLDTALSSVGLGGLSDILLALPGAAYAGSKAKDLGTAALSKGKSLFSKAPMLLEGASEAAPAVAKVGKLSKAAKFFGKIPKRGKFGLAAAGIAGIAGLMSTDARAEGESAETENGLSTGQMALGAGAAGTAGYLGSKSLKGVTGAAKASSGVGKLLGKSAKLLKGARALPLLGTVIGAGFALKQAYDLYEKWRNGEEISPSDKVKMVTALGAMIPGIGAAVVAGDITADLSGAYDKLDEVVGPNTLRLAQKNPDAFDVDKITEGFTDFGNYLISEFDNIADWSSDLLAKAKVGLGGTVDDIIASAKSGFETAKGAVASGFESAKGFAGSLPGFASDMASRMAQIGTIGTAEASTAQGLGASGQVKSPTGNDIPTLTSPMGMRDPQKGSKLHQGIDLAAAMDSAIVSAIPGVVKEVNASANPSQNYIAIEGPDGIMTRHRHLSPTVKVGQSLQAGDQVGTVNTRNAQGGLEFPAHQHFEVMKDGKFLDPVAFLKLGGIKQFQGANGEAKLPFATVSPEVAAAMASGTTLSTPSVESASVSSSPAVAESRLDTTAAPMANEEAKANRQATAASVSTASSVRKLPAVASAPAQQQQSGGRRGMMVDDLSLAFMNSAMLDG